MTDTERDRMAEVIDQYIWSELHREILKRRIFDKIKYEPLAEEFNMSVSQVKRIVYQSSEILFRHIERPSNMLVK